MSRRWIGSLGIGGLVALSVLSISPYVAAQSDEAPAAAEQMGPPTAPAPSEPEEPKATNTEPAAQQPTPDWIRRKAKSESPADYTKPQTSSWRGVFALIFVMVLGGAAVYMKRRRKPALAKQSELEVLHTAKVGPKAQVVVARVAGRRLLLGVTESNVKRLAWLDEESAFDAQVEPNVESAQEAPQDIPGETSFRGVLKSFLSGRTPSDVREGDEAAAIIARETEDVVYARSKQAEAAEQAESAAPSKAARREMLRQLLAEEEEEEVEGQVAGLLRRRRSA